MRLAVCLIAARGNEDIHNQKVILSVEIEIQKRVLN